MFTLCGLETSQEQFINTSFYLSVQDSKIVKLEKEIASFIGKSSEDSPESIILKELKEAKASLAADIEKLKKANYDLESENSRACEQLKRSRIGYNRTLQQKDRAEEKLRDLEIEVSKASKQLKEVKGL